jgi:hypothetical protein
MNDSDLCRPSGPLRFLIESISVSTETTEPPKFLGNPCPHALFLDPGGAPFDRSSTSKGIQPSVIVTASASAFMQFRGSLARPVGSLCTLRGLRHRRSRATLGSDCGPALSGGFSNPRGSYSRFPLDSYLIASSLTKLAWRSSG